jgi:hypothetical protein
MMTKKQRKSLKALAEFTTSVAFLLKVLVELIKAIR